MSPFKYYNAIKYYFSAPDEKRSHGGHRGQTPTQVPALDDKGFCSLGRKLKKKGRKSVSKPIKKVNLPLMKKSWTPLCDDT